jgi:hypothetical protein
MPHPSHSSWFDHSNIGWGVQIIKVLIMQFSSLPCFLVPLRPKYFLNTLFSHTLSLRFRTQKLVCIDVKERALLISIHPF